ncbi:hypothetical protein [Streptomyces canus]|uniref:hypothetical protein n=1 Tax=Streptomyces canus TaxID=58343 RepID=UPI003255FD30
MAALLERAVSGDPDGDVGVGALLADLSASSAEAAAVCGFGPGFVGDVRAHLVEHLAAMRQFYRAAAHRGRCVVVWVD